MTASRVKTQKRRADLHSHPTPVVFTPPDVQATAWYYNYPRHRIVVVETRNASDRAYLATVEIRVPR